MKLKDALKRIEELERLVKELQAQPKQEFHHHYHYQYQQPWYLPQPWIGPTCIGAASAVVGVAGEGVTWTDGLGHTGTYTVGPASYGPDN